MSNNNPILVFISNREEECAGCGDSLTDGDFVGLQGGKGAQCLACAELDRLIYLPSGNTALTRRAKKYSTLSAIVLKYSKARKRSERQGLLVEKEALERAEADCLSDADARARRRERDSVRRERLDQEFVKKFAAKVRELFPHCPAGAEEMIAEHACLKFSGRVGRTAAAKSFEEPMIRLAVIAHIRHAETDYDELLMAGYDRQDARSEVQMNLEGVLEKWRPRTALLPLQPV